MTALGRRAVACRGWLWMAGMLVVCGIDGQRYRLTADIGDGLWLAVDEDGDMLHTIRPESGVVSEPLTKGALLALVREAWGGLTHALMVDDARADFVPHASPMVPDGRAWVVYVYDAAGDVARRFFGATEAEALVAALEAAP